MAVRYIKCNRRNRSILPCQERFYCISKKILKTKIAIERNIEIIGEAVNRVLKIDNEFPITHARKIIDTRNRIIHGYDTVSDEIIWSIVVKDLPDLKNEITKLLK